MWFDDPLLDDLDDELDLELDEPSVYGQERVKDISRNVWNSSR